MPGGTEVRPHREMHPEFGEAIDDALNAGVKILFLRCKVEPDKLWIEPDSYADLRRAGE